MNSDEWSEFIFDASLTFQERFSKVFRYQSAQNPVYKKFSGYFGFDIENSPDVDQTPLLPVKAFKLGKISIENISHELLFRSSGTISMDRSKHHIHSADIYKKAISKTFYSHFPADQYSLLCYMPGYDKNPDSSLIWMAKYLISNDASGHSRFIELSEFNIQGWGRKVVESGRRPLLFGAAFGLLDLIDSGAENIPEFQIIETGGMKTHRREMTKFELRNRLFEGFGVSESSVHSEYGMCELLSQMYAISGEWYRVPHWVHVSIRKAEDPASECKPGEEGKIGIIDLANVYSCPFILAEDRGVMNEEGRFKILGRWHARSPRGCNFLIDSD